MSEEDLSYLVELEVENEKILVDKNILIKNSDYFSAMFAGYFVESKKSSIPLKAVKLTPIRLILEILQTNKYKCVNETNIFSLLETTLMLQFLTIYTKCIDILRNQIAITEHNCHHFWLTLDEFYETYGVPDVYFKARYISFLYFYSIGFSTERLKEFSLQNICQYLGNINLRHYDKEINVLKSALTWYSLKCNEEIVKNFSNCLKLLSCIDYQQIQAKEIEQILIEFNKIFEKNHNLTEIFKCLIVLKRNEDKLDEFDEFIIKNCALLLETKRRFCQDVPCFVFSDLQQQANSVVIAYYDPDVSKFKKLFDFELKKLNKLEGYRMFNYHNYLYLYGGEYSDKESEFHGELHAYNFITETVEELPIGHKWFHTDRRRDFDYVLIKNMLYIITGRGSFWAQQQNICCIDLDDPAHEITQAGLPLHETRIKTCSFQDQLIIMDIFYKRCWFFNESDSINWTKVPINDPNKWIERTVNLFSGFSYNGHLFIKGNSLLELELNKEKNEFNIIKKIDLKIKPFSEINTVLCKNMLYTFYKHDSSLIRSERDKFSFEILNMDTLQKNYIFENENNEITFCVDNKHLLLKNYFGLCPFVVFHHNLCEDFDEYVNRNFF